MSELVLEYGKYNNPNDIERCKLFNGIPATQEIASNKSNNKYYKATIIAPNYNQQSQT